MSSDGLQSKKVHITRNSNNYVGFKFHIQLTKTDKQRRDNADASTYIKRNDRCTVSTSRKQIKDWWSRVEKTAAIIFAEEVAAEKGARLPRILHKGRRAGN